FDPAVQSGEATLHRVAQDVRNGLTGPRAPGLRPESVPVELLADLRDPLALEVSAENQGHDSSFLDLDLEDALYIVVAIRTRIGQERVRFLHRVVERLDIPPPAPAAEDFALIRLEFRA